MITPHSLWYRLRALVSKRDVQRDIDDELAFHIDMETERQVANGVQPSRARAQAMRAFGDATRLREECIDERGVRPLDDFARDVRFGARMLRRSPIFTAVTVLTLAVGIGAATTIYGVVDRVLLEPLGYADEERLVTLRQRNIRDGLLDDVAPANYLDWRDRSRTIELMAAAEPYSMDYRAPDGMAELEMWLVSSDLFPLLGGRAMLGRAFTPDEFEPGANRVLVLGHATWHERFGGDSAVVGTTIALDGAPFTIVGVMPPEFEWPPGRTAWAPLTISEENRQTRGSAWWIVLGRLRDGATLEAARREMSMIASELADTYPATNADIGVQVTPFVDALLGASRPALALLAAAAALLLLIACANVANIVLARSIGRSRELALRSALGARPQRLVRQMITEVLILTALGALLGVMLAVWAVDVIRAVSPSEIPRIDELTIDGSVLAFAALAAMVVALLAGAVPAAWVARGNLGEALKEGGRTSTSGPRTRVVRATLAVGQVTLATMLLIGAGLLARSFVSLLRVERGYDTTNVVAGTVQAWQYFRDREERAQFVRQAVERLAALPDASAAGVTSALPLAEDIGANDAAYVIEGRGRPPDGQRPTAPLAVVAGSYFEALRVPVRRGRAFDARDRATSVPVAIVNAAFARQHWPNEDALGRRLTVSFLGNDVVRQVVGVVGDMRHEGLHAEPRPTIFIPHAQAPTGALWFVVRARRDPGAVSRAMRAELSDLVPAMPVETLTTLDTLLDESLEARRFQLALIATFSLVALLLAAVGVYGVMSHATAERTHEIGVRYAMGAQARSIIAVVMRAGLTMAVIGIALGALGAAGALRAVGGSVLSAMLFETTAHDLGTYLIAASLILITALLATAVPALRATRVHPAEALRG